MEAEAKTEENAVLRLERLAQLLGLTLHIPDALPEALEEKQRELFFTAAQEAVINAVKHGEAKALTISFAESEDGVRCTFENGGNVRVGDVRFSGGLANLQMLAKEQNAVLSAEAEETFKLHLLFPKNS